MKKYQAMIDHEDELKKKLYFTKHYQYISRDSKDIE